MAKIGIKFYKGGKVYLAEDENIELSIDDAVVVESSRGIEIAYICALPNNVESEENIKIVRKAKPDDLSKLEALKKNIPNVSKITNRLIAKYKLEMKLVDVGFTLDGSKVIISYVCEDRVDFRELVKDLAYELKLRIELKQIGVRDQAKVLGGIGLCGKECCCKQYLNDFDKVSVKMAKVQGLSLNPTKISGLCGRLMCCLAYENDTYAEISAKMPKLNSKVKTKDGVGIVVYNNLLKQTVSVKIENNGDVKINDYELNDIDFESSRVESVREEKVKIEESKKEIVKSQKQEKEEFKKHNYKHKKKFNNTKKNDSKK